MNLRAQKTGDNKAFTLTELLVVIGTIAVLSAIALPLFRRTKQQADVIKTLSNMKQMGVGMLSYANDNNYLLPNRAQNNPDGPTADRWPVLVRPCVQDLRAYTSPIPGVLGTVATNPTIPTTC